ncbi:MAG TPA: hypothetical protein VKN36_10670, partial [Eudoraea sp.]|nr:hypothetical protein [Eudoraea sp.]
MSKKKLYISHAIEDHASMILVAAELRKKGFMVLYDDFIGSIESLKKTGETFIEAADIFLVLL